MVNPLLYILVGDRGEAEGRQEHFLWTTGNCHTNYSQPVLSSESSEN